MTAAPGGEIETNELREERLDVEIEGGVSDRVHDGRRRRRPRDSEMYVGVEEKSTRAGMMMMGRWDPSESA